MVAPSGELRRPKWLDRLARQEWDRVVPVLVELGTVTPLDEAQLANYCATQSLAIRLTRELAKEGEVIPTAWGPKANPKVAMLKEARAQATQLADRFGLNSSARSRINAPEKPKTDDAASFLFGPLQVVTGGKNG